EGIEHGEADLGTGDGPAILGGVEAVCLALEPEGDLAPRLRRARAVDGDVAADAGGIGGPAGVAPGAGSAGDGDQGNGAHDGDQQRSTSTRRRCSQRFPPILACWPPAAPQGGRWSEPWVSLVT